MRVQDIELFKKFNNDEDNRELLSSVLIDLHTKFLMYDILKGTEGDGLTIDQVIERRLGNILCLIDLLKVTGCLSNLGLGAGYRETIEAIKQIQEK